MLTPVPVMLQLNTKYMVPVRRTLAHDTVSITNTSQHTYGQIIIRKKYTQSRQNTTLFKHYTPSKYE